jgi:predicted short-subunit dehydrogenase-like oxidoreductase (DUF2520 family)
VGAVLGAARRAEGHAITGAYAVSDASRERATVLLPGVPVLDVATIVSRSELVLLSVPDDQLPGLADGIARTGIAPGGQVFVHTAGRFGTEVLAPLEHTGAGTVALHPAMTFTGTERDLARLVGCPVAITARTGILPVAQALTVEIGAEPVVIAEADRPLYHAALAHGANHLVVLVDQARTVLSAIGIQDPGSYLRPLLEAALEESLRRGAGALTGPVLRGDRGTIAAHLESLAELDQSPAATHPRDLERTYRALALGALYRSGLSGTDEERLRGILEDGSASSGDGPSEPA